MNLSCVPRVDLLKYDAVEQCNLSHGTQLGKDQFANDMVLILCTETEASTMWTNIAGLSAADVEEIERSEGAGMVRRAT